LVSNCGNARAVICNDMKAPMKSVHFQEIHQEIHSLPGRENKAYGHTVKESCEPYKIGNAGLPRVRMNSLIGIKWKKKEQEGTKEMRVNID
jgi:hypothetical protein